MHPTTLKSLVVLACAAGVLRAAQTPPADAAVTLSPFEVTEKSDGGYRATNTLGATRTDTPISDLPLIINTVTEEFMRDMAAFEVDQAIEYLGGVSVSFNEYEPRYSIRGFISTPAMRNGVRAFSRPDTNFIERVEAIKGPAALLYGQTEPGGVINYTTKKPKFDRRRFDAGVTFGSEQLRRATANFSTPLGEKKKVALQLGGSWHEAGWAPGQKDLTRATGYGQIGFRPWDGTMLTVSHSYQRADSQQALGLNDPLDSNAVHGINLGPDFSRDGPSSYIHDVSQSAQVELTQKLAPWLNGRLNYANYRRHRQGFREDGFTPLNATPYLYLPGVQAYRNPFWVGSDANERRNNWQGDLVAKFATGPATVQMLVGGEYDDVVAPNTTGATWNDTKGVLTPAVLAEYPELNLTASNRRVNYRYNIFAPGAQARKDAFIARFMPSWDDLAQPATYPVNKTMSSAGYTNLQVGLWQNRLRFFAGGRYDFIEIDRRVITRATKAVSSALAESVGQFSPQAGAVYRLRPGLNVYGLYSQSVNPRFTTQPVRTAAAEALVIATFQNAGRALPNLDTLPWGDVLDPEEGQGYEAGVKLDSADGRRSITIGGFTIERVKVSTIDPDPILGPSIGFRTPGGLDRAHGLDVDFNLQLLPRLQVLGGYTFIESKRVKNENPLWVGKTLPNAAKHQGNLWARYSFGAGRLKGAALGLGYTAISDRRDDSRPLGFYSGFYRFDANFNYPLGKHLSTALNVQNLTNKAPYWTYRDRRGQGRSFLASLRYRL